MYLIATCCGRHLCAHCSRSTACSSIPKPGTRDIHYTRGVRAIPFSGCQPPPPWSLSVFLLTFVEPNPSSGLQDSLTIHRSMDGTFSVQKAATCSDHDCFGKYHGLRGEQCGEMLEHCRAYYCFPLRPRVQGTALS